MNGLQLYFRYVSISIQSQLQYRASFIMMSLANFTITFVEVLAISFLFDRFGHLRGWEFKEVALLYGIISIAFALSEAGARGFDILHRQVRSGEFDRILMRPRSTVLQVIGSEFQIYRVGRLLQGLLVLIWATIQLGINWTASKIVLLVAAVFGGAFLFSGLFVLQATLSFWSVESLEIANTLTYGGVETAQYPISIYSPGLRKFFIYVVPLACINYFPALGILDKVDPLGFPTWIHWASPLLGVVFFFASLQIWELGIRYYRSTGS